MDGAFNHLVQGQADDCLHPLVLPLRDIDEREVERLGVGELRALAPAAVPVVELLVDRVDHVFDDLRRQLSASLRAVRLLVPQLADAGVDLLPMLAELRGDHQQPPVHLIRSEETILRDQVGVRSQVRNRWPTTRAVAIVDIGPPVRVDLDGDVVALDHFEHLRIGERRLQQVSAVCAPGNGEHHQDRLALGLRLIERALAEIYPRMVHDGIMAPAVPGPYSLFGTQRFPIESGYDSSGSESQPSSC